MRLVHVICMRRWESERSQVPKARKVCASMCLRPSFIVNTARRSSFRQRVVNGVGVRGMSVTAHIWQKKPCFVVACVLKCEKSLAPSLRLFLGGHKHAFFSQFCPV